VKFVIGEIDRNESNPYYYLNREMTDRLFYKYPSRKQPLGNRQTVATATTTMMRLIQSRYYVPNNSTLVVTGDVKPEEIFQMAQEFFGDWARREKTRSWSSHWLSIRLLPKSEGRNHQTPVQNVIFSIGWHGPSIGKDNEATYAADVFSFIYASRTRVFSGRWWIPVWPPWWIWAITRNAMWGQST